MPEQENIGVGVTFAKIVDSVKDADVNNVIKLFLISGLTPDGIVWVNGDIVVETNQDSTVVFTVPGTYRPKVLGEHFLHESYNIIVH